MQQESFRKLEGEVAAGLSRDRPRWRWVAPHQPEEGIPGGGDRSPSSGAGMSSVPKAARPVQRGSEQVRQGHVSAFPRSRLSQD